MKEYLHKETAAKYKQTKGKALILFPILRKYLSAVKKEKPSLLDIGCGNGDFYQLAHEEGYTYSGLDIAKDMIDRAVVEYPDGKFFVASATDFASRYSEKFDVVVMSMLHTSLDTKEDITKTFEESKKVLSQDGRILVGIPYPCFDGYMQGVLFGKKGVIGDLRGGYFLSKGRFKIEHKVEGGTFTFENNHWTLQEYYDCIRKAGLTIEYIDECKPSPSLQKVDKEFYEERIKFPTYMVIVVK